MRAQARVTIRDVAATAGVSPQTVSRVLNNRPDVAAETRQHIRKVIEELEYQPSAVARSLSQPHSFALGVVIAGLQYAGPSRTLNGITEQAERMGYVLLLKELPRFDYQDLQPTLKSLLARHIDGIIWAVSEVADNRAWLDNHLASLPVPAVFITMQPRPGLAVVAIDNYAGGRMATEHLLAQGYQHIGHISGPLAWWEARQRRAGWQDALLAAGVQPTDLHAEEGDWSSASGEKASGRLLASHPETDALFVGNDQMALGVLQMAGRQGIRVPQDLALIGFDGLPETAHYCPPLTTVYQDLRALGSTAVQDLVWAIGAASQDRPAFEPKAIYIRPELIVRESSTPRA